MKTLEQFTRSLESVPASTAWYLGDLGEAKGRQEMFIRQSPQRLQVLREHALIQSTISSNRIEGVEVDRARVGTVLFGKALLHDRPEEEVRGYREALSWIHERGAKLPVSQETFLDLHRLSRGRIADAGKFKEKDGDIIETYPDGRSRVRFKPVPASETPRFVRELVEKWQEFLDVRRVNPLVLLAAFNLDFLCIHPFRDGNGRVSRLLLLLQCYHLGFDVGRYVSLERLIEENKERYYETLETSSKEWHTGKHNPWPYINYLLSVLKMAYLEFEERLGKVSATRGEKTALVIQGVEKLSGDFSVAELQRQCPGVSLDMIRRVLKDLRAAERVECLGRGLKSKWRKTEHWELGNTQ